MDYVYYSTDGSFDYHAPTGSATYHTKDLHGFSCDIKGNKVSIGGFGDYAEEVDKVSNNLSDFIEWLKQSLENIKSEDEEATSIECFEELIEELKILI